MKVCKKVFLPLLAGFLAGALTTSLSVFLFVNRFFLAPEGMKDIFENDANALSEDGKGEGIYAEEYEVFQILF